MEHSVITVVGPDSMGIMETIAGAVAKLGANIEETRATILGGDFAVIMLVAGSAGSGSKIKELLPLSLEGRGMTVLVRATQVQRPVQGIPYMIESISLDTPGIVRAVTSVLLGQGINIENLESNVAAAPLSGSPMFRMRIAVTLTPGSRLATLKDALSKIAEAHDLDITIRPMVAKERDIE
ncbi:MAG: glycine cleavage system transcriptional repressor [Spirochaetes bacterium]|nr:MAG: glycine cleavage system transcriptional repressor [Spirochaetota bacterium]